MTFVNRSLTAKLVVLVSIGIALILGGFALFLDRYVSHLSEKKAEAQLQQEMQVVMALLESFAKERQGMAVATLDALADELGKDFSLHPDLPVKIGEQTVPTLKAGSVVLNLNYATLDRFRKATGSVATLFAKQGDDFIRIATSLTKENGERAIGTFLGKTSPAYEKMLAGGEFTGRAKLFGREYVTRYRAIKGADGKVIGVLFTGLDITEGLNALKNRIRDLKIGETGYYTSSMLTPAPQRVTSSCTR